MLKKIDRNKKRIERHNKQRNKIKGTHKSPRLNVFRSSKHIYAQVIDDISGATLASASTIEKEILDQISGMKKVDAAKVVGLTVGKRAVEKGIDTVVFDRGGYLYHGRVKSLADGARESGLKF